MPINFTQNISYVLKKSLSTVVYISVDWRHTAGQLPDEDAGGQPKQHVSIQLGLPTVAVCWVPFMTLQCSCYANTHLLFHFNASLSLREIQIPLLFVRCCQLVRHCLSSRTMPQDRPSQHRLSIMG